MLINHDTVESSVSFILSEFVEDLVLTGGAAIAGAGNRENNHIWGNGAANVLNGDAGDDTLEGGGGDDTYYVESLNDLVAETRTPGGDIMEPD